MSMPTKDVTTGVVSTIGNDDLVMVAGAGGWSPINKPTVRLVGVGFELTPFSISTAADADVINTVSLISGGGKTLLHNQLRNYVERRWVA